MTILKLDKVWFQYQQKQPVLSDINLEIKSGEKIVLLGANGSGKSTLLKLFNGLLMPTQGRVLVNELSTTQTQELIPIREQIGYIFQNPESQIIGATVREEVAFGPGNLGLTPAEIKARVEQALELTQMAGLADQPTNQLSGGQKQKLTIAAALAMQPKILVCDEATAMMDKLAQRAFMEMLTELQRHQQITLVLATHDLEEVAWANRVLLLNQGTLVFDGPPAKLFGGDLDLVAMGLEVPPLQRLIGLLRQEGCPVPEQIDSQEKLVMWLVNQLNRG